MAERSASTPGYLLPEIQLDDAPRASPVALPAAMGLREQPPVARAPLDRQLLAVAGATAAYPCEDEMRMARPRSATPGSPFFSRGRSSSLASSVSVSMTSLPTWYDVDVRRHGLGAARRNEPYFRSAAIGGAPSKLAVRAGLVENTPSLVSVRKKQARASGTDQLFAVLTRLYRQLRRQPLLLTLQLLVPLVFVIITVILWATKGTEHTPQRPMRYDRFYTSGMASQPVEYYPYFFCYNGTPR